MGQDYTHTAQCAMCTYGACHGQASLAHATPDRTREQAWTSPQRNPMLAAMHEHPGHRFDPKNIHKLEDPERLKWIPVDAILDRLQVKSGMTVADVGAGAGFFALPMAKRVGSSGKVFAIDSQPEMLGYLRKKLDASGIAMELVEADAAKLSLPDRSVDLVFMANVWHEIDDRDAAALEALRVLRKGGRLAVLDWRPDSVSPPGPPLDHRIGAAHVHQELTSHGYDAPDPVNIGEFSYLVVGVKPT
jgi:SAM-dependent methyltransferase